MVRATNNNLNEADRKYGYRFGCDGLMSIEETCEFLNISRWTLNARIDAGHIRKGKHLDGRAVVICRRSVQEYLSRLEC